MAVVSVTELPQRSTTRSANGGYPTRSYKRVLSVTTDTPNMGPGAVLDALGYRNGQPYQFANESDTSTYLQEISCDDDAEDGMSWLVSLSYGPYDPETSEQPELSGNFRSQTVPLERDVDGAPIVNSAGDPFIDPPIEGEDSRLIINIVRKQDSCPWALIYQYKNAVNSDPFLGADPGTWKVVNIAPVRLWDQDKGFYFKITYEFEYNPDGWRAKPLNAGYRCKGTDGKIVRAMDKGTPVPHPVLLSGSGARLSESDPPVYLDFKVKPELPFEVFAFGDDISSGAGGKPGSW